MTKYEAAYNPDLGRLRPDIRAAIFDTLKTHHIPFLPVAFSDDLVTAHDKSQALITLKAGIADQLRATMPWIHTPTDDQISFLVSKTVTLKDHRQTQNIFLTTFHTTEREEELPPHLEPHILRALGYRFEGDKREGPHTANKYTFGTLRHEGAGVFIHDYGTTAGVVGPWAKWRFHDNHPLKRVIVPRYGEKQGKDQQINDGVNWDGEVFVDYATGPRSSILLRLHDAYHLPYLVGESLGMLPPIYVHQPYADLPEEIVDLTPKKKISH